MADDVFQLFHLIDAVGGEGVSGHNPPRNYFQELLSLNIGDTEQDTVGP